MASGKTTAEDSVSLKNLLIDIMRTQYPDIAAYQNGQTLYAPESPIEDAPQDPIETPRTADGGFYINTSEIVNKESLTLNTLVSIEPINGMEERTQELLDQGFDFFSSEVPVTEAPAGEIETDIFISTVDFNTNDAHDLFIREAAEVAANPTYPGLVYYILRGEEYAIRSYKTLEVMLAERGLDYSDIRYATSDDRQKYKLDRATKTQPSLATRWGYQIRFQSGYRPVAPFVRDPADYYKANEVNEFGTPYLQTVYEGQSYKEKLRTIYEGKACIYDIFFDNTETVGNDAKPNPNFGQPTGCDVAAIRIMTLGYWKWLDDTNVLRMYNEVNGFGADIPSTRVPAIINLFKAGGVTNFEAAYAGPIRKKNGSQQTGGGITNHDGFLSGWNDFPHITSQNILNRSEYENYLDISNNGNPFDLEYMKPYEPAGSVKYYSTGTTNQLAQDALAELDDLQDQLNEQYQLDALKAQIHVDIDDALSEINLVLSGQYTPEGMQDDLIRLETQRTLFLRDVQLIFNTNADYLVSNNRPDVRSNSFITERISTGEDLGSDSNLFRSALLLPQSGLTYLDQGLAKWIYNNKFWHAPGSPVTIFGPGTFQNLMYRHPNGVPYNPDDHTLVESLMENNRLAYAISTRIPFNEGVSWNRDLSAPAENPLYETQQVSEYGTLTDTPTQLDNYIDTLDYLTRTTGNGSMERYSKLMQLEDEFEDLHTHLLDKTKHRYRSQIIGLLEGHNTDSTQHRGYTDIYNEYIEVRDQVVGTESGETMMYEGNRAMMFAIYFHIAYYRYTMLELGYNVVWPSKSYQRIINYLPELGEDVELYFGKNIFDQEYSDQYQGLVEKYHIAMQRTENAFNSALDGYQQGEYTDENPGFFQQYTYSHGPADEAYQVDDFDMFYGWMAAFGPDAEINEGPQDGDFAGSNDPDGVYGYS